MEKKIKWLKEKGWSDDLIHQQLCVDYNIDNLDDLFKDIKIQFNKNNLEKALLAASIMVGIGGMISKLFGGIK